MTARTHRVLRVFVSSPSDVAGERADAIRVIRSVSDKCRDTVGMFIDPVNWESMSPQKVAEPETIQERINVQVADCHVFVLILGLSPGSKESGSKYVNVEREINLAIEMQLRNPGKRIMAYCRDLHDSLAPKGTERALRDLRARLTKKGLLFRTYNDIDGFKYHFTHDLYETVLKFHSATLKTRSLRAFWQLGGADDDHPPQIDILYPPVSRRFMQREKPDNIWTHRLSPHVVFENFKAMQKVEKTLRLVGVGDIHSYGVAALPADWRSRNRVWVCLPRNPAGRAHFARSYTLRSRFTFAPTVDNERRSLIWKGGDSRGDKSIEVQSPLNAYLEEQRRSRPGGEFQAEHLRIVAKDYSILARFSDTSEHNESPLRDFYVSGLRGLGTWGAAWFLDRRYKAFLSREHQPDEDVQMLLEVTLVNGRIENVVDVSAKPQSYFSAENSRVTIQRVIAAHR